MITKTMGNTENRPNNSEQVRMHSPDDNKTQLFFCVAENGFGRGNYDNQGVCEITVRSLSKYGSGSIEYSEKWQDSLRGGVQPLPEKEGDSNCNQS